MQIWAKCYQTSSSIAAPGLHFTCFAALPLTQRNFVISGASQNQEQFPRPALRIIPRQRSDLLRPQREREVAPFQIAEIVRVEVRNDVAEAVDSGIRPIQVRFPARWGFLNSGFR